MNKGHTRESCPEDTFKLAQSNGPYPGASATFLENLLSRSLPVGGRSDESGTVGEDDVPPAFLGTEQCNFFDLTIFLRF